MSNTPGEIKDLLFKRIQEHAVLIALEAILTADVDLRRQYEREFNRVGMSLESVRVEGERHRIQDEAAAVKDEIERIVELWLKAAENEHSS